LIIEERNLKIEELQGQLNKSFDTISNIGSECIDKVNDAIERVEKENQKEILSLKNDIDLLRESINIYKQKLNDREIAISVKNLEIESLKNTIKENQLQRKS
jgi:chromosome segregation ATPase